MPYGLSLLIEIMMFQGQEILDRQRYSTWEEAQAGHRGWVNRCYNHPKELTGLTLKSWIVIHWVFGYFTA